MGFEPQTFRPTVRRANHCATGAGKLTYLEFTCTSKVDRQSLWSLLFNFLSNCFYVSLLYLHIFPHSSASSCPITQTIWMNQKQVEQLTVIFETRHQIPIVNYPHWLTAIGPNQTEQKKYSSEETEYTKHYHSTGITAQEMTFKIHKSHKTVFIKVTLLKISCLVWKAFRLWSWEWSWCNSLQKRLFPLFTRSENISAKFSV